MGIFSKFTEKIHFGNDYAWIDVPEATKFYAGLSLTVSPLHRGLGLGKELIRKTLKIGQDMGCSHCYIIASSKYSQKIFRDMGFRILHQESYDQFVDKDGQMYFKDTREHQVCQVLTYDLKQFNFDTQFQDIDNK